MLLFVADNLACFPYQSQDEPLFIMHHVNITLSVSGSNLLQSFKEVRKKKTVFCNWAKFYSIYVRIICAVFAKGASATTEKHKEKGEEEKET